MHLEKSLLKSEMEKRMDYQIENLKNQYNADRDLIPGAPLVTWTDRQLLEVIERLEARITTLEAQIKPVTYKCASCAREQKQPTNEDGLCRTCSMARARKGLLDNATEARMAEVVKAAQTRPDPQVTRQRMTHSSAIRKF